MPIETFHSQSQQSQHWQCYLGHVGQVVTQWDDIAQCLATIATTKKGSVPLMPTFGSDVWRYQDWPITRAGAHIVRELTSAWTQWEPRIQIDRITPRIHGAGLVIRLDYRLLDGVRQSGEIVMGRV